LGKSERGSLFGFLVLQDDLLLRGFLGGRRNGRFRRCGRFDGRFGGLLGHGFATINFFTGFNILLLVLLFLGSLSFLGRRLSSFVRFRDLVCFRFIACTRFFGSLKGFLVNAALLRRCNLGFRCFLLRINSF
jgi:hypothetical protein